MNKVTCIDVSYWNGDVDFKQVKNAGINAVIIRAGYGRSATQKDSMFEQNYKEAKAAGLKVGVYWYSYADSQNAATLEVKACLEVLGDKKFDLPVYYDLEESKVTSLGRKTLTTMAETFCEAIKKAGYKPGVYANLNWFKNYLDYTTLKSKYSIWLAQYYVTNGLECDIWQNSSEGSIPGVNGNCDTNIVFNETIMGTSTAVKVENKTEEVCEVTLPVLKKGAESGYVKTLQILLNKYNDAKLLEDGKFGTATYNAVVAYQKSRKLTVDGVVGPNTWAYLLK